jgi:hypothetical protein
MRMGISSVNGSGMGVVECRGLCILITMEVQLGLSTIRNPTENYSTPGVTLLSLSAVRVCVPCPVSVSVSAPALSPFTFHFALWHLALWHGLCLCICTCTLHFNFFDLIYNSDVDIRCRLWLYPDIRIRNPTSRFSSTSIPPPPLSKPTHTRHAPHSHFHWSRSPHIPLHTHTPPALALSSRRPPRPRPLCGDPGMCMLFHERLGSWFVA